MPPHKPMPACCPIMFMGYNVNGDFPWDMKNLVCSGKGRMDVDKFGTGRYHAVYDPEEGHYGHCPREETSSMIEGNVLMTSVAPP